jgi:TetR/AcrR family transcriptional regulator
MQQGTERIVNCLVGNARTTAKRTKPQRRDPVATRKKLLTAARREFARRSRRQESMRSRAGVNKQLVYHYFGDKDALYLAVLEWVYEEIRTQERKLNLEGCSERRSRN